MGFPWGRTDSLQAPGAFLEGKTMGYLRLFEDNFTKEQLLEHINKAETYMIDLHDQLENERRIAERTKRHLNIMTFVVFVLLIVIFNLG